MSACWWCGNTGKNRCRCGAVICDRHTHYWLDDVADSINRGVPGECLKCSVVSVRAWRRWRPRPFTLAQALGCGEADPWDYGLDW